MENNDYSINIYNKLASNCKINKKLIQSFKALDEELNSWIESREKNIDFVNYITDQVIGKWDNLIKQLVEIRNLKQQADESLDKLKFDKSMEFIQEEMTYEEVGASLERLRVLVNGEDVKAKQAEGKQFQLLIKKGIEEWRAEQLKHKFIRYGDVVRVQSMFTNWLLFSNRSRYTGKNKTSKQTRVLLACQYTLQTLWIVRSEFKSKPNHRYGDMVQSGDVLRLTNFFHGFNLHSHTDRHKATIQSGNNEVTAYHGPNEGMTDLEGNQDDNWKILVEGEESAFLKVGTPFLLQHCTTNNYLHDSAKNCYDDKGENIIKYWREVNATKLKEHESNKWRVETIVMPYI